MGDVVVLPVIRIDRNLKVAEEPKQSPTARVWCKPRINRDVHDILLADAQRLGKDWNSYIAHVLVDRAAGLLLEGKSG